jgi:hypothetical protein
VGRGNGQRSFNDTGSATRCLTAKKDEKGALTNLAPEIQEAILFLPRVESGPNVVKEIDVRRIARVMDWGVQRERWHDLFATSKSSVIRS